MNKFKPGDRVRFKTTSSSGNIRNNYVIKKVLAPGERVSPEDNFPGWGIQKYVNTNSEPVYVCPDGMCGITFAFRESEIESI